MAKHVPKTDFYSKSGAAQLVESIMTYWHRRGFQGIVATAYQNPAFPGSWFVRSNIGSLGFPPRRLRRPV